MLKALFCSVTARNSLYTYDRQLTRNKREQTNTLNYIKTYFSLLINCSCAAFVTVSFHLYISVSLRTSDRYVKRVLPFLLRFDKLYVLFIGEITGYFPFIWYECPGHDTRICKKNCVLKRGKKTRMGEGELGKHKVASRGKKIVSSVVSFLSLIGTYANYESKIEDNLASEHCNHDVRAWNFHISIFSSFPPRQVRNGSKEDYNPLFETPLRSRFQPVTCPPIFIGTLITRSHYRINVTFEHRKHARSLEEHPETKRHAVKDLRKRFSLSKKKQRDFKQRGTVRSPNAFARGK